MPTHVFRTLFASSLLLALSGACRTVSLNSSDDTTANQASSSTSATPRDESRHIRNLRKLAAHDLNCAENKLAILELSHGTQSVKGCGKRATYVLIGPIGRRQWALNVASTDGAGGSGRQLPNLVERAAALANSSAPAADPITTKQEADGKTTLTLDLPRDELDLLIRLKARPAEFPDQALLIFQSRTRHARTTMHECSPRIVVNGDLLAAPPSTFKHVNLFESLSVTLSMTELHTLSSAVRVLVDICGKRVEIPRQELSLVLRFLVQFKEELALSGVTTPATTPNHPAKMPEGQDSL